MRRFFLLVAVCLCTFGLRADTVYTFQTSSGLSDGDGNLNAMVTFDISGSTLYVAITNNEANPTALGQLISDLSFSLSGGLTDGTLSSRISSVIGSSSPVTVLDNSSGTTTTTTLPSRWQLTNNDSSSSDCGTGNTPCYFLNSLTGGKPNYMIIGPGPYANANSSITGHFPSLAGQVVFEIDGITGLTSSTSVNGVYLSFGGGPDVNAPLIVCPGCGGGGVTPTLTPEPASLVLIGSGLLLVGLRRVTPKR